LPLEGLVVPHHPGVRQWLHPTPSEIPSLTKPAPQCRTTNKQKPHRKETRRKKRHFDFPNLQFFLREFHFEMSLLSLRSRFEATIQNWIELDDEDEEEVRIVLAARLCVPFHSVFL